MPWSSSPDMDLLAARSEEGEEISRIAYQLPRLPVEGFTVTIQAISYLLCILSTIIVGLRVYVRWKLSGPDRAWGWDDICAVAGWVPFLPSVVFLLLSTHYGLGARDNKIPDGELIYRRVIVKEYMFYFEMIYFASSVLTKLAMAIMIIRLTSTKIYHRIIWGNMIVLAVNATACLIIMFVSCDPIPALWNEKLGHCRIKHGWIIISYAGSVVLAMVDWTCAITPFFILQSLQMPRKRKISVQIILGLGIFGSAAGLVRMGYYHTYDTDKYPNQSLYSWGHTILWSVLEAGLGIMACSLPPLRKLFKKPVFGSSSGPSGSRSALATGDGGTQLSALNMPPKGGLRPKDRSQWDRLDDEQSNTSQQHIIKSTHITVETSSIEDERSKHTQEGNGRYWKSDA